MPLIEELPTTNTTRASHGWAYVPDVGPSKAILPPGSRKRGAGRDTALSKGDISSKQQKIIQAKLADLDKENYKDTVIPIPPRPKDKGRKITTNVRRILTYQRTFAHYLADEEAQLAQAGGSPATATPSGLHRSNSGRNIATMALPGSRSRTPLRQSLSKVSSRKSTAASTPAPTYPKRVPSVATDLSAPPKSAPEPSSQPPSTADESTSPHLPVNPASDANPLLKSETPKFPSARVMEALLAEPPLTYNAARATPADDAKPVRHFCAICGYWGKVRCRKCGERTCGLMECWKAHEAGCLVY